MANETSIGWTDLSWNPVHGCSVVSPGCAHCYAATDSLRRGHTKLPWTPENAAENVLVKPHKLKEPFSGAKVWRGLGEAAARAGKTDGKLVFVNSMSDLFHEEVPNEFIAAVFGVMLLAEKHTFQVLTKRPERMLEWFAWYAHECRERELVEDERPWFALTCAAEHGIERARGLIGLGCDWPLPNVWLGVSIENRRYIDRADMLRETPAAVRFISAEPLLGPLIGPHEIGIVGPDGYERVKGWASSTPEAYGPSLDLMNIDWLIVGGESGLGYRPMREEWVRDLRDAILFHRDHWHQEAPNVHPALFVKQGSGPRSGQQGDVSDDLWGFKEFPQVREAVVA